MQFGNAFSQVKAKCLSWLCVAGNKCWTEGTRGNQFLGEENEK